MATKAHPARFLARDDGSSATEFAMVLPLLLLLLFGVIEVGRLVHDYHLIQKGVRDAARYLSRVAATCDGVTNALDVDAARNLAMRGDPSGTAQARLGYWTAPGSVAVAVSCEDNGGAYSGVYNGVERIPSVTVTASVPFTFLFGGFVARDGTLTLTASDKMVHIGE